MESSPGPTSVWLVYLAACVVAFVAVARFAPETKDARRSSEERYAEASGGAWMETIDVRTVLDARDKERNRFRAFFLPTRTKSY